MQFVALCTCEKVIIDKRGAHSLINLMLNAEIQATAEQQIPRNAVVPTQWFIYTMWVPSSEDIGKKFEQVYQVYWPDGEKFTENRFEFTQPDDSVQQVTFGFVGFPVGQTGKLRIVTWLDQAGHRVSDLIETSIRVKHVPQGTASPVPAPLA
jgi:hypothetical protein